MIVCYAKCEECRNGCCFEPPIAHSWADANDIAYAASIGEPAPIGLCACPCAQEEP